jgi:putative DNA primase/helicase
LPHSREHLITKTCGSKHYPVWFDPKATCERWLKFLAEVFPGEYAAIIPFLRRAIGYSLTGLTREECLFLMTGDGRNGKGSILNTLMALLGDYGGTAAFSTFLAQKDDSRPREDIASMVGKRFISAQETKKEASLAEEVIKSLTGGDMIRARRLYANGFEFTPKFKIWLATNHKPKLTGTDLAIWSRLKTIPFTQSFAGREDKNLKSALLEELSGILNWAIEGCQEWQEGVCASPM